MRISVAAACAFAAIFAKDITPQAIAAPILPTIDKLPKAEDPSARGVVSPEPISAIAAPEQPQVELPSRITAASNATQSVSTLPLDNIVQPENIPEIKPPSSSPAENNSEATPPPAPEDFNPNPNPLQIPTQPAEVETREVVPITLEQALGLAQRNSQELQIAQLELQRTQAALRETQAADQPTLDTNADLTTQQAANSSNSGVNAVLGGTVEMNYDLYTSGRRSALINAAEGQVRSQALQVEVVSKTLQLDVTNAYYALQEADQQVRIAQAALEQAERSLRDATSLELAGVGTRLDRLQAEVDVANSRQGLTLALGQQQTARRQLRQRLNIAEPIGVSASDPVEIAGAWNSSLEESIILAYTNRAELQQQLVQREISQQQRRAALAELGPQISLFANFRVQNSFDQGVDFSENSQVGARLSLRLLDGGAARARADQEEANTAIAETQFSNVRGQVRLEVEQAYLGLQSNLENIQTAAQAVDTAAEALRLARLRFQAGIGTQSDVSRSQTDLTRAEVNRLQTVLNYNRALASLQRAVSPLDAQPSAQTPPNTLQSLAPAQPVFRKANAAAAKRQLNWQNIAPDWQNVALH